MHSSEPEARVKWGPGVRGRAGESGESGVTVPTAAGTVTGARCDIACHLREVSRARTQRLMRDRDRDASASGPGVAITGRHSG